MNMGGIATIEYIPLSVDDPVDHHDNVEVDISWRVGLCCFLIIVKKIDRNAAFAWIVVYK